MRRLTHQELETTLSQLFEGIALDDPLKDLPGDEKTGVFSINSTSAASLKYVSGARYMAESIAQEIAQDPKAHLGCEGDGLKACVRGYLEQKFWPVAIQLPVNNGELDGLMKLYDVGQAQGKGDGVRFVFEALLQAPSFLYKSQAPVSGQAGAVVQLGDLDIAYRMAALFWRGVPDQELLMAASRGELVRPEGRLAQARRMMEDPLAKLAMGQMLMQWFDLDSVYGDMLVGVENPEALAASMVKESSRFIDHVVQEEGANYKALLGAKYSFIDERLAKFHGLDTAKLGEKDAQGMWRVELEGRAGILTHPAVLSQHQHGTIFRGKLIRLNILCGGVANLEDQSLIDSIKTEKGESDRSKAQKRLDHPTCKGCHMSMEPLGLPFDVFDAVGRFRVKDEWGTPVHGRSDVVVTKDLDGTVSGPLEFVGKLVESKDVEQCVAKQVFTYSFARTPTPGDTCAIGTIQAALTSSKGSLNDALLAVVQSDAFATTTTVSKEQ